MTWVLDGILFLLTIYFLWLSKVAVRRRQRALCFLAFVIYLAILLGVIALTMGGRSGYY